MAIGQACTVTAIPLTGRSFERLVLGAESQEWWLGVEPPAECHDCNVVAGQLHHLGCDMEQCPNCGNQLLTCGCAL